MLITGNIFEAVTVVQGETIQSSRYIYCVLMVLISNFSMASCKHQHFFPRWPCTRSFANPEFFSQDKNSNEKGTPSVAAYVSAKNSSTPLAGEASPKNNASALATENNLTPGKRQQSKKT
jgi:hypothetical protein